MPFYKGLPGRLLVTFAALLPLTTGPLPAAPSPITSWEEFSPPPLTIIYPEEKALSNPPFLHWAALPAAPMSPSATANITSQTDSISLS